MRYQLAYCGVDYENVYFEQDENHSTHDWLKHKFNLGHPFPNLPHFIDGDVKLSETNAVHQYIARKYKPELLGKTPADQARIEMFLGPLGALKWGVTIPCYTTGDREAITAKIRSDIEPLLKFIGDN
jgi:glutathione S-transferase